MMPYIWKHPFGLDFPSIHSYGAMAVVALLMAVWLVTREGRRVKLDPDRMFNVVILLFVVGLVGARVLYIVVNWSRYAHASAWDALKLWEGGLVWYGGIIAAVPVAWIFLRTRRLPLWEASDVLYIATMFGLGFARWGCFLAGCCYGDHCELPWAVTYTHPDAIVVQEMGLIEAASLHPAPIYASLVAFAITGLLAPPRLIRRCQYAPRAPSPVDRDQGTRARPVRDVMPCGANRER